MLAIRTIGGDTDEPNTLSYYIYMPKLAVDVRQKFQDSSDRLVLR